jgi:hypothetical protein
MVHRFSEAVGWEFLTHWSVGSSTEAVWEPEAKFLTGCDELWMNYILHNNLDLVIEGKLDQVGTESAEKV